MFSPSARQSVASVPWRGVWLLGLALGLAGCGPVPRIVGWPLVGQSSILRVEGYLEGYLRLPTPDQLHEAFWQRQYEQALALGMAAAVATQSAQSVQDWQQVEDQWRAAIATLGVIPYPSQWFEKAQQKHQEYHRNAAYANQAKTIAGANPRGGAAVVNLPTATVISVGDGDTLRVQWRESQIILRLACIDAPETNQPFGPEATQRLRQLLPAGQTVRVRAVERDLYNRTVAEIYVQGQSIGLQLVQEGYAVVYSRYLSNCSATADQYGQAEAKARTARLGFWSQPQPTPPWEFRQGHPGDRGPSSPSGTVVLLPWVA